MQVELKSMPKLRVGCIRHIGPYNQIARAFDRLGGTVERSGLAGQPGAAMVAIYHDDPKTVPAKQLLSDAGIVVPEGVPLPSELTEQRVPAGRYARTIHVGSYELLGETWARLRGEWLPASGQRLGAGPSYEIYLNTPGQVPPEQLRTELYLPIAGG